MKWIVAGLAAVMAVAVGAWWYQDYRTEAALLAQPVYRVLKQHDRPLYDKLLAEYRLYQQDEVSGERYTNFADDLDHRVRHAFAGPRLAACGAGHGHRHAGNRQEAAEGAG